MLKSIKEWFKSLIKWVIAMGMMVVLVYVIFKIISSKKNPDKFSFLKKIWVINPVNDSKKKAVDEQGTKVDIVLDNIRNSIKESEEFLNGID